MNKLRVLTCAFTCCPPGKPGFTGGEDTLGWNLVKQVARCHEVWVLTQEVDRVSIDQEVEEEELTNLHFCYVGLPKWLQPLLRVQGGHQFYYQLWQMKAYFVAKQLNNKVRFDLFHHITYANDWMVSYIGALLPVPYVRGPGGGAHRTPKGFQGEYPFTGQFWEKVRSIGQWLFRHDPFFMIGQRRARAILVCTRESIAQLHKHRAGKVQLFPVSGISSKDLQRPSFNKPSEKSKESRFQVLTAGSLIRVKGFGLAIKAFKEFSDKHPGTQFDIIGSGPEEPRLRSIAQKLNLSDKVKFRQEIPRDALLSEMSSHDVFLFPSLRDGGGTVVVEAMASGVPVVCLDTGGPGTHITEECGVKIAPSSPAQAAQELAVALERLYLDDGLRHRLGEAGRERAEQLYQWEKLGDRLMQIYRDAVRPQ